jgi:hypothetical protein
MTDILSCCSLRAESHILKIVIAVLTTLICTILQVTLEEFTALMTGAIGGRDPMQVKPQ